MSAPYFPIPHDASERLAVLGLALGPSWLFLVDLLRYCAKERSDGAVPRGVPRMSRFVPDPEGAVQALVEAGLLAVTDTGWQVVDYAVPFHRGGWGQQTAVEVESRQEASRESSKAHRERTASHARGDHSKCTRCSFVRDFGLQAARDTSLTEQSDVSDGATAQHNTPQDRAKRSPGVRGEAEDGRTHSRAGARSFGAASAGRRTDPLAVVPSVELPLVLDVVEVEDEVGAS